jgi:hypothetical protein
MAHDVFISHSSRDKPVSDAVCAALENAGIRCWVAPRDVQPGRSFAGEITRAIQQGKAMVLIFSANSNTSSQVLREVQLAVDSQLHILQFRIEEVLLNDDLKYYLSTPHWLDAMTPPLENHLDRLATSLRTLLGKPDVATEVPIEPQRKAAIGPDIGEQAPPRRLVPPSRSSPRTFPRSALVGAVLLGAIILALAWYRQSDRTKTQTEPQAATAPKEKTSVISPSVVEATPLKGASLFRHNFDTAEAIIKPLFGPNIMSVRNSNGEGEITARAPGILPAIFDKFLLDDFVLDCGIRAETVPPGARYGFIFRAADVEKGGIARYYALLFDPNKNLVEISLWKETRWVPGLVQSIPEGLLQTGRKNRITLEAFGAHFRIFIDGRLVSEPTFADPFILKEGRIGLCLAGTDSKPWTVYFDNFQIFLPPGKEAAGATSTNATMAATRKPFEQSWDFSGGMLRDIRTEGVEAVDAAIWKMTGGKHLRFLTGGRSFLETTFDVPDGTDTPTTLTVRHLSSSPDGKQPGYSPVRITLNGSEIFRGSPAKSGWMEERVELGNYVQPGRNTLLWEYLDGAQTHYWLKSFRLNSGNR